MSDEANRKQEQKDEEHHLRDIRRRCRYITEAEQADDYRNGEECRCTRLHYFTVPSC